MFAVIFSPFATACVIVWEILGAREAFGSTAPTEISMSLDFS